MIRKSVLGIGLGTALLALAGTGMAAQRLQVDPATRGASNVEKTGCYYQWVCGYGGCYYIWQCL